MRILDLLEELLSTLDMSFLRLDGDTDISTRQGLVREFNEGKSVGGKVISLDSDESESDVDPEAPKTFAGNQSSRW